MKNQIPLNNSQVFNHEEEIGFLKDIYPTKCAPPHTLRKRILADVNKVLTHSLKDRLDSFTHYLLIINFISLILFFQRDQLTARRATTSGPPSTRSKWFTSSFFITKKNS